MNGVPCSRHDAGNKALGPRDCSGGGVGDVNCFLINGSSLTRQRPGGVGAGARKRLGVVDVLAAGNMTMTFGMAMDNASVGFVL